MFFLLGYVVDTNFKVENMGSNDAEWVHYSAVSLLIFKPY